MKREDIEEGLENLDTQIGVEISDNLSISLFRCKDDDDEFFEFINIDISSKKFSVVATLPEDITLDDLIDGLKELKKQYKKLESL